MTRTRRIVLWSGVAAVGALLLAGCGNDGTKAGGDAEPITLRIGTDDVPGRVSANQIDEFARRVGELSGGRVQIEPVWSAAGPGRDDWDQAVAQLVIDGDLDLAVIPARSWDVLGVTTLRPLHAPFLVTTDTLMDAVVADPVADEMLSGLDEVGVTGLALMPEGIRHVFSFGAPLVRPSDFTGATVRAPTSDTTFALFEALNATADDFGGPTSGVEDGVANGSIRAAESSFAFAATLPGPTTVVANLALYPKVNVIVANAAAFGDLASDDQQILREAALATRDWAIEHNRDDADYVAAYCADGGTVVLADDDSVAAMHDATRAVFDDLAGDEHTADILGRITELARDAVPAPAIAPCAPDTTEPTATDSSEGGPAEFPEGTYRTEMSTTAMIERGLDPTLARGMAGISTLTIENGTWRHSGGDAAGDCVGTYFVERGRITLVITPACGGPPDGAVLFEASWTVTGDELRFTEVDDVYNPSDLFVETTWGGHVWTRIDDVEPESPFPEGTYRGEFSRDELLDRGVDADQASSLAGINTITFDDGLWTHEDRIGYTCNGTYTTEAQRITVVLLPPCGADDEGVIVFDAAWAVGDGGLRFSQLTSETDVQTFIDVFWGGQAWTPITDPSDATDPPDVDGS